MNRIQKMNIQTIIQVPPQETNALRMMAGAYGLVQRQQAFFLALTNSVGSKPRLCETSPTQWGGRKPETELSDPEKGILKTYIEWAARSRRYT